MMEGGYQLKKPLTRIVLMILLLSVLISELFVITLNAEEVSENISDYMIQIDQLRENGYKAYLQNNKNAVVPADGVGR